MTQSAPDLVHAPDHQLIPEQAWFLRCGGCTANDLNDPDHPGAKRLGRDPTEIECFLPLTPGHRYNLTGWVRNGSGATALEVTVVVQGVTLAAMASALVDWRRIELAFIAPAAGGKARISLRAFETAFIDQFALLDQGIPPAAAEAPTDGNSILLPAERVPVLDLDVPQLATADMTWMLDAKFGMFIHWGPYAGLGVNEWVMHSQAIPPDAYAALVTPASGDQYFAADRYDPAAWARLAREVGMGWLCLTARHHDGYNLFAVPYAGAFTSIQTHGRDFIHEYVTAVRDQGLRVGLYFSPLNWRYPGYFNWTGSHCHANAWGYQAESWHHENARRMKEENYVAVRQLVSAYGQIDHLYWDGGWMGHATSDRGGVHFHEPGRYLDPANAWPLAADVVETEIGSDRPLGIMGLVRKYQPTAITNPRYGWIGDLHEDEGHSPITGPVRSAALCNKSLSIHYGGWGYLRERKLMSCAEILRMLCDCVVRNMTLLLNIGPDRHGVIPGDVQERLREVGAWVQRHRIAIVGTRGGPWDPVDGRWGSAFLRDTVYLYLYDAFPGSEFMVPPVGPLQPVAAWQVDDGRSVPWRKLADGSVLISQIQRRQGFAATVLGLRFAQDVLAYAKPRAK
jgi:alpha-L-fucosidase